MIYIIIHISGAAVIINNPVDDHDDDRAPLHATTDKWLRKFLRAIKWGKSFNSNYKVYSML